MVLNESPKELLEVCNRFHKSEFLNANTKTMHQTLSFADGIAGPLLVLNELNRLGLGDYEAAIHEYMLEIVQCIEQHNFTDLSLYSGLTGVCFTVSVLYRTLDRYENIFNSLNEALLNSYSTFYSFPIDNHPPPTNTYDVILGAAGIGRYVLEHVEQPGFKDLLTQIISSLIQICCPISYQGGEIPGWLVKSSDPIHQGSPPNDCMDTFNLGMAHGITGILALFSLCAIKGFIIPQQIETIVRISDWICKNSILKDEAIGWPNSISLNQQILSSPHQSALARDAWCYGTPGVARTLFLTGKALDRDDLKHFALTAYSGVFNRSIEEWQIPGPMLCHGLSGLLLITQKMSLEEQGDELKKHLPTLQKALLSYFDPQQRYGFLTLDTLNTKNGLKEMPSGWLEGSSGALLTLLTLHESSNLWDLPLLIDA